MFSFDALQRAIRAKSELIRQLRQAPPKEWEQLVRTFVSAIRNSGLRDHTALVTLLTDLIEELPDGTPGTRPTWASLGSEMTAKGGVDPVVECEQQLNEWLAATRRSVPAPAAHVRQMKQYLDTHYSEAITLAHLSIVVGREKGHLASLFRKIVGCSVRDYLARVRVEHAVELIQQGNKIEVAMLLVGYRSKKNFYQQFVRTTGLRPGMFRRSPPSDPGHAIPSTIAR